MKEFIKQFTREPVCDSKGNLRPDIEKIISRMKQRGSDPIEAFKRCQRYLADRVGLMEQHPERFEEWEIKSKEQFRPGTKASMKYMLTGMNTIVTILVRRRFDSLF